MARKNGRRKEKDEDEEIEEEQKPRLHPDTWKSIWGIAFSGAGIILALAYFDQAGPAGETIRGLLETLVGWGYLILPISALFVGGSLLFGRHGKLVGVTTFGGALLVLSVLGLLELFEAGRGGWLGLILGSLKYPFGGSAATVLVVLVLIISILVTLNLPLRLRLPRRKTADTEPVITGLEEDEGPVLTTVEEPTKQVVNIKDDELQEAGEDVMVRSAENAPAVKRPVRIKFTNYVPPPPELLETATTKATTGDLRANANIIKRTLESFGITVEMGEINIGPKVTRFTLKPAEGVKIAKIAALSQDLSLALAAHPIRIEAPIPGKSLVGIEVPNKAASLVRLGSLIQYNEFASAGPLVFALGRDVTGDPVFANIEKMPHLLIAGATGSGKSVTIHALILSLLYKNSPSMLQFVMVDPKRVELSIYQGIPHLVSPVVTESKKAINVFRWAIRQMEDRYAMFEAAGSRNIESYNAGKGKDDPIPYIVIVVDELADLMTAYGRDVEGAIVRLAQMARATGIHLVLSTQRPSVEVITGLIKANITGRVALQVASQIDSRTILDMSGAEKLLGGGDLLFTTSDLAKPKRIQGAYVTEEEITRVAEFIRENNKGAPVVEDAGETFDTGAGAEPIGGDIFDDYGADEELDEHYDEALELIRETQKASTTLLQRHLSLGYARAARLIDQLEKNGVIGPGDGAKPRQVFVEKNPPE